MTYKNTKLFYGDDVFVHNDIETFWYYKLALLNSLEFLNEEALFRQFTV